MITLIVADEHWVLNVSLVILTYRSLTFGKCQEVAESVSTACKTGTSGVAATLSFARRFGNGMSGVNLPFNG